MGFGVDRVPSNYKVLGLHQLTSDTATASTHTTFQAEGLTKSITYGGNRILRMSVQVHPYAGGGDQRLVYRFMRGSTPLSEFVTTAIAGASLVHSYFWCYTFAGPSSGATETFGVQFRAASANTQVQSASSSIVPRVLLIEDLGPQ